jgi:hypothetical protein
MVELGIQEVTDLTRLAPRQLWIQESPPPNPQSRQVQQRMAFRQRPLAVEQAHPLVEQLPLPAIVALQRDPQPGAFQNEFEHFRFQSLSLDHREKFAP